MKKIAVITGTRADYGIFRPVLNAIQESETLELALMVTGMHLSEKFGCTIEEIIKDGFQIAAKVPLDLSEDTGASMARDVGACILGLSNALKKIEPDLLMILGDRGEMLATAIAGIYMNIPVAHIHGGEVSGTVDESIRHAITKLSHIHFPATEESALRIRKLGENDFRIHVVGAPALDTILSKPLIPREKLIGTLGFDPARPIILAVQHPVTTELQEVEIQIRETLEALCELGEQTVLIYPNADAGGRKIIEVIEEYRQYPFFKIYKSLKHVNYLSLLKAADIMVGNSSSGIIEAPSFGLPVVNIGTRQLGRQRAENVIDVDYRRDSILKAVRTVLYNGDFRTRAKKCANPYGDGKAAERIVGVLEKLEVNSELLNKKIVY